MEQPNETAKTKSCDIGFGSDSTMPDATIQKFLWESFPGEVYDHWPVFFKGYPRNTADSTEPFYCMLCQEEETECVFMHARYSAKHFHRFQTLQECQKIAHQNLALLLQNAAKFEPRIEQLTNSRQRVNLRAQLYIPIHKVSLKVGGQKLPCIEDLLQACEDENEAQKSAGNTFKE